MITMALPNEVGGVVRPLSPDCSNVRRQSTPVERADDCRLYKLYTRKPASPLSITTESGPDIVAEELLNNEK